VSSSTLLVLIDHFRAALVEFDPLLHSGEECGALVEALAVAEKACAAVRVRAAARAGACGVHKERGFAETSDWLARVAGTSSSSAKSALDTAAALSEMPEVSAAVDAGELSMAQATELVKTEASCPGSVAELLATAKASSLKTLKDQARERRQRVMSPEELYAAQRRAREFRYWRTALGTVAFRGELPPDVGVPIMNRLDAETDRLWQRAWSSAKATSGTGKSTAPEMESRRALAADAFVRLVETGGKGKAQQADLVVVCDLRAYRRGHAHDGEPCHVVGGGPIPVSVARELGRDAFLKAVLHDGTRIDTIAHFGRRSSAVLRTALMLGTPPGFPGVTCSHPSCDRSYGLERDHIDPVANGGPTSFDNLGWLCKPHHRAKTQRDRKAGLLRRQPSLSARRE
jgi:hypothetical protein